MSGELPIPGDGGGPDEPIEPIGDTEPDSMAPTKVPCECSCLHCGRTFMSDQMWFQRVIGDPNGFDGFWMCPTPNCSGAGFAFDIFPTDPHHPANDGWVYDDDEEEDDAEEDAEWDPAESKYHGFDDEFEDDDDLEGEEWKHGLEPGERPMPDWAAEAQRRWEEEQKKFNEPDRRPRELDWSHRKKDPPAFNEFNEDDIPF